MISPELFGILEPPHRRHGKREVDRVVGRRLADTAGGELRVLLADCGGDVRRRQAELRHPVGPHPDADRVVLGAEVLRVADARNAPQLVDHVKRRVVRNKDLVVARIGRVDRRDLQNRGGALAHRDALAAHLLGERGHRGLHAVVDVDRREIRVRADGEGHRNRQRPVPRARRAQVEHPFDTVYLLLERCGNGLSDRRGVGAGVERRNLDLGRQDVGVGSDRQRHGSPRARRSR
jgi:hypothetical protein